MLKWITAFFNWLDGVEDLCREACRAEVKMETIEVRRENLGEFVGQAKYYKKIKPVKAVRMDGPFQVESREGILECPDGYLAVDSQGWPYPIAKDEFEAIYVEVPA